MSRPLIENMSTPAKTGTITGDPPTTTATLEVKIAEELARELPAWDLLPPPGIVVRRRRSA
jgi:hypothetical protein